MAEVKELTPPEAWRLLQSNPKAMLIDVRSRMEFLSVGHAIGAVHIPWIDEPDWRINPARFVAQVRQVVLGGRERGDHREGCAPIILICRSGYRSREAGDLLLEEGMEEIYNVSEGFEGELNEHHQRSTVGGWRYHGLPWEQC